MINYIDYPPKFNSSPLKMDGWNTSFLLGWPIFRGCVSKSYYYIDVYCIVSTCLVQDACMCEGFCEESKAEHGIEINISQNLSPKNRCGFIRPIAKSIGTGTGIVAKCKYDTPVRS